MSIGGNTTAIIQIKTVDQNDFGEDVALWVAALPPLKGWLDFASGDSKVTSYNAKVQESTHIFLCDYIPLVSTEELQGTKITPENSRVVVDEAVYEVMIYDNPMNMNQQLEIYLKYVGGVEDGIH